MDRIVREQMEADLHNYIKSRMHRNPNKMSERQKEAIRNTIDFEFFSIGEAFKKLDRELKQVTHQVIARWKKR
jgi:hypothetical protein